MAIIERRKRIYRKRIPYGMQNFEDVIKEDCYYVDKTPFIEEIEDSHMYFFYFRPRRFGKSLTLSMLQNYYDINKKDKFEKIFGGLYIGENPTPERNSYLIIDLNFSKIANEPNNFVQAFNEYCYKVFEDFVDKYSSLLPAGIKEELKSYKSAVSQFGYLCGQCCMANLKLYLFIDNYDYLSRLYLTHDRFHVGNSLQTLEEQCMSQFFAAIKGAAADTALQRMFVSGEIPVNYGGLTSGFNIGTNYSFSSHFNELIGFSEKEVRDMLDYYNYSLPFRHTVDDIFQLLKTWYDNYCFIEKTSDRITMYNSAMVLYFLDSYIRNDYQIPKKMVETNIRIDYDKIRMLIRHDKAFAHDASIIQELVTKGFVTGNLVENFPAECINDPDNFLSLLFYFGLVTIDGTYQGNTKFIIPNEVVRDQIYTYLLDTYKENDLTYDTYGKTKLESRLAYAGEYKPYFDFIADSLKRFSSQRDKQKGEAFVHGFTLAMTSQCKFYRPISELDNDGGYADIFLLPLCDIYKDMTDSYIVELKYCKSSTTDAQVEQLFQEASAQVCRYADSDIVRESVKTTKLHKLVVVYRGIEMAVCKEASKHS